MLCSYILGTIRFVDGQQVTRPHSYDCKKYGKCTGFKSCGKLQQHPEHKAAMKEKAKLATAAAKRKTQDQAAAIAGMKPPMSPEFDVKVNKAFASANLKR